MEKVYAKVIACHNIKGGVGKSTTAVNLSYNLSSIGRKVLGIDFDPQKNYTPFFRKADEHNTVFTLMKQPKNYKSHIYRSKYSNLDVIKGSSDLTDASSNLLSVSYIIQELKERYDYIIIDCRTSYEALTRNALCVADMLLTPVLLDGYCRDNLADEKEIYDDVCYAQNKEIIWGVFGNKIKNRKSQKEIYIDLTQRHIYPFLNTCITERTAVEDALRLRKPLGKHSINNQATLDFMELTNEIIGILEG